MHGRRAYASAFWALLLFVAACQPTIETDRQRFLNVSGESDYPLLNPYAATVIGTPEQSRVELPREIPTQIRSLPVIEDRVVPTVFWYENRFRYSLATQPQRAPLVFIIAGTNAGHSARYSDFLQKVFFVSGYHVASLSSPTFPNFIVTASETSVPGRTGQDAKDLYHVMQRVLQDVRQRADVDEVSLIGYSLGGWQAAFVAEIDDREKAIGFHRVVLVNPPVSLYRSAHVLDDMLINNLPGGIDGMRAFIDRLLGRLTEVRPRSGAIDLSPDALYQAYAAIQPTPDQLAALIAVVFRLAATNIAFTADVMTRSGYLVPADRELRVSTSLTPYFDSGIRRGFQEYFRGLLYPYYKTRDPDLTDKQIIEESSLESIAPFISGSTSVGLVTNADDVILAPGDLELMKEMFADRATIFPHGGHCGNLEDQHTVAAIMRFMEL